MHGAGTREREEPLDTSVAIETPEHIVFRYRVAGPARRLLAYLVDLCVCYGAATLLCVLILFAVVGGAALGDAVESVEGLSMGLILLVLFAAQWVYFVAWEASTGRTPGKMAAGLRVVTTSGRPVGFGAAALRNVLRAADALPMGYAVGVAAMALSPRFQRLGDLVAGTMVIVPERPNAAALIRLWPPAQPGELAALPEEVRLDAQERNALEMFLRRRGTLGPAREHELASMIAEPLEKRFGFRLPDPARTLALLYDRAANAGRVEGPRRRGSRALLEGARTMALIGALLESAFVARRQREWDELDALVRRATAKGLKSLSPEEVGRVSPLYRDVCADLARAQAARYGAPLLDYLHGLTAAAHGVLYASQTRAHGGGPRARAIAWISAFPRTFRKHKWVMALAFALFFVPFFGGLFATLAHPDFAFRVAPEAMLRPLTEAYAKGFDSGRAASMNAGMAGFYVNNNVGIALRCFAVGIFGGIGSAFYLIENGLATGAILGYVASQGAGGNILTFVLGHSTFELGAIAIAGGAGMSMGWSVVAPGDRTRLAALEEAGKDAVVLVSGAAIMLFMAEAIEAFWSASAAAASVKRIVGVVMLAVVVLFLALVGRDDAPEKGRR